jgi:spermidine/putrescine transport system substrate-binding protein
MKKFVSLLLVCILIVVAATGCSQSSSSSAASSAVSSSSSEDVSSAESSSTSSDSSSSSSSAKVVTGPGPVVTGSNGEPSTELNLYTWENMFPQEVLDAFTAQTGIKVNYSVFDTDETMLSKLETSNAGDYDLVIADDYIIQTAISENLVMKLDWDLISNASNINPLYQSQFFDPNNEYTVPYGAGVQTIVYNPDIIKIDIKGYSDLWDASLQSNVGIISSYRVIDGMALKVLGESYNTEDTSVIDKAGQKLIELAPNIRLIKDDNLQDDLLSGEIGAAVMYTSQVTSAKMANPNLKVVYPEEGIGFGIMAQFIPANAPHSDASVKFMNYILDPQVSAQCYEYLGYYCTNKAAEAYISDEYKDFLTLPDGFSSDKMEMIQNISSAADEEHVKIWTAFKNATE